MASLANLLRGTDREFFDLFERAGANIVRAAELLDGMLARHPESPERATSSPASTKATRSRTT